jgi:MinD-like ATPase involved in chromosome partitioning or flagellar assembly
MGTIAFASAKGSPGVTTTVAALAATWPDDRDLHVVELDPSGGDLVVRFDLGLEPGLVTLAAAGRRDLGPDLFVSHTQVLPSDAGGDDRPVRRVLPAPVAADQAGAALTALRTGLSRVLRSLEGDVLIDCGRLDPTSPSVDAATEADLLVMVARPIVAEVHHLAARLSSLRPRALSLLLIGDRPYSVSEVAGAVGATPLGTLPVDGRAASVLTVGHPKALKVLRRSRLLRDARAVADGLAEWLGAPAAATPSPMVAPPPAPPPPPPPPERAASTPAPPPPPPPAYSPPPAPPPGTNGHGNGTGEGRGPKHFRRSGEGIER